MIRSFGWLGRDALSVLACVAVAHSATAGQRTPSDPEIRTALARISPSLVRIHVVTYEYEEGREIKREAAGSGTIISADGHVLTNHHVAGRTRTLMCTLADREEIPADLIGTDPLSDIAIIKLRPAKPRTFPVARFGDVAKLKVGDPVMALGSPLALSQSVTLGIVSNTEMIMPGLPPSSVATPVGPWSTCQARSSASTKSAWACPAPFRAISRRKWRRP